MHKLATQSWRRAAVALLVSASALSSLTAEEPKQESRPRPLFSMPLAVPRGETTKLKLRGQRLDQVTEVKLEGSGGEIKLLGKDKAGVPAGQEARRVGDSQVELELTLPADAPNPIKLVVTSPGGSSEPIEVLVDDKGNIDAEQEPNDGFTQAGALTIGRLIDGQIDPAQNVDVYAFTAAQGQKLAIEVLAQRRGNPLDPVLTLYDARGTVLAMVDDQPNSRDPLLEWTAPAAGKYFLSIGDAGDQAGPTHLYRLLVRQAP